MIEIEQIRSRPTLENRHASPRRIQSLARSTTLRWLTLAMASMGLTVGVSHAQPPAQPPAPIEVETIEEVPITPSKTFVGTVYPLKTSVIGSAVDGRVVEFPVNEGDRVAAGQPLAQLLTGTLEIELAGADAELDLRNSELAELETGTRPEEIAQAEARMRSAKARREFIAARHRRKQRLYERNAITEDEFSESLSLYIAAEEAYLENQKAHELAVAGPRKEVIAQAQARVRIQEEIVHSIADRIKKHTLRAPFDGFVVEERTEVGQWLKAGEVAAVVIQLNPVEIEVHIPEAAINYLSVGMPAAVNVDAIEGKTFAGKVTRIMPQADRRSRTFPIKVEVENPPAADGIPPLKAGMLAHVTLTVNYSRQALLVPKDALVLGGPTPTLFVVDPQPGKPSTVRPVPVALGVSQGGRIQVTGDLRAGQQVVVRGNERLRPGQEVEVVRKAEAP
jgi:RND family efflux transporter MFP subunit